MAGGGGVTVKIISESTEYNVALEPPRIVKASGGQAYEVHRVRVDRSIYQDGINDWTATVRGYKLNKDGRRSKAAPHALMVVGYEAMPLEDEAIGFVQKELGL